MAYTVPKEPERVVQNVGKDVVGHGMSYRRAVFTVKETWTKLYKKKT